MKSPSHVRSGSALLIVLGMTAFMLFSGLAFSVYMRYSRLPTSFLRRTTTTHQLARAAVAEAIEAIDKAIGDDPHPGVRASGGTTTANYWYDRVFFGEERTSDPAYDSDTVATLTLEGLAYLPPNMINDMRYYSRCTPTAKWRSFWFDSGRYAYTAIDVSDYFDVNRLIADRGRAACASRRISLAHLFEAGGVQHSGAGKGAEDWDKMIEGYGVRKVDTTTGEVTFEDPFVSLADFNIAWTKEFSIDGEAVKCPFRRFIEEGTPYGGNLNSTDPKCEYYKNLTFVTDSWLPTKEENKAEAEAILKPFGKEFGKKLLDSNESPGLDAVLSYAPKDRNKGLGKHLSLFGAAQLWDYLDTDSVPVSLAIPTLERTPMVVGVECGSGNALPTVMFTRKQDGDDARATASDTPTQHFKRRVVNYNLSLEGRRLVVNVLGAYPFRKYVDGEDDGKYTVDGRVALFFTAGQQTDNMTLRPGQNDAFLLTENLLKNSAFDEANGVASIVLTEKSQNSFYAENFSDEEPAGGGNGKSYVRQATLEGDLSNFTGNSSKTMFTVTYEWPFEEKSGGSSGFVPTGIDPEGQQSGGTYIVSADCKFKPLNSDGAPDDKFANNFVGYLKSPGSVNLSVHAAVWVRIKNQEQKTVDLVPAGYNADEEFGAGASHHAKAVAGSGYPLLRFDLNAGDSGKIPVAISSFVGAQGSGGSVAQKTYALTPQHAKVFVSDPRYNHLPENWYYTASTSAMTPKDWADEVKNIVGQGDADSDIYMATSDQGYLQSVYELAFLPRWTENMQLEGGSEGGSYTTGIYPTTIPNKKSFEEGHESAKDDAYMWRTYRCYYRTEPEKAQYSDPKVFQELAEICRDSGFKVNPYSDSTNVLMAAFANTPIDWRCSSTNDNSLAKTAKDAKTFNDDYAWNGYSSNSKDRSKIRWEHLQAVAGHLKDAVSHYVSQEKAGTWETAFRNLIWSSNKRELLTGIQLEDGKEADVYGVDKKFLCGFWHDSFGVGQQLFLIFVRAEPMMMGGGVAGQAPPQLGARAVALVWRDPNNTLKTQSQQGTQNAGVHRTRILFYHQFD